MPKTVVANQPSTTKAMRNIYLNIKDYAFTCAREYIKLDPAVDRFDVTQEAFIALSDALSHWDKRRAPVTSALSTNPSFKRLFVFYLRKRLFGICKKDKVVNVYQNNCCIDRISYSSFLKKKRYYMENGFEWRVESLTIYGEVLEEAGSEI